MFHFVWHSSWLFTFRLHDNHDGMHVQNPASITFFSFSLYHLYTSLLRFPFIWVCSKKPPMKTPTEWVFVNCRGSGSGGRWEGGREGVSADCLTHFPTPDPESGAWWNCSRTVWVHCVHLQVGVKRLSDTEIHFYPHEFYCHWWNPFKWN